MPWGMTIDGLTALQQRWTYASQRLGEHVGRVVTRRLDEAVTYARATYLTGGTTATRLAERTGRVKASFTAEVQVGAGHGGTLVTARIGYLHGPSWIGIHEYGGTIRARQAKYLAIPLTDAARGMRPRAMDNTFVARSRRTGSLLIFQKREGGGIEPQYLLRTEVTIRARPALRPTMEKFTPLLVSDVRGAVRTLFQRGA